MAARLPYDAELQMFKFPAIEFDDEIVARLGFMRWLMEHDPQKFNDGWVEGKSDGPVIDFIKAREEREQEQTTAA